MFPFSLPWNSKNKVGLIWRPSSFEKLILISIWSALRSSILATGIPYWIISFTEFIASFTLLKWHIPLIILSGIGFNFNCISVITPKVPSEPINNPVKLYPAEVFLALPPVLIICPSGKTIVNPKTFVLIVPYLTAIVPEAEVEHMPPIDASAPGSMGKNTPWSFKLLFNWILVTAASTLQSKSSLFTSNILFKFSRLREIPSAFPTTCPSKEVPAPKGTIGILCLLHNFIISATSSVLFGNATPKDSMGSKISSPLA